MFSLIHKSLLVGVVATLLLACAALGQQPTTLRIASYNVQNLQDVFDDPYSHDEVNRPKPREQIEQLAAAIEHLNADVLALQEVENQGVLQAMLQEFLPDMGYRYWAVLPTNSQHGMHLGVISRWPILSITSHRLRDLHLPGKEQPGRLTRDIMYVTIQIADNKKLHLFNVHWKSRRGEQDADHDAAQQRLAEAVMTRQLADEVMQRDAEAWVVVAGDFNDTPDAETLQWFLAPEPDDGPLWHDAHAHLPEAKRVTYLRAPYRSTIDYLLVSPAMKKRLMLQASFVLSQAELLDGSDHAPVVAQFNLD